MTGTHHGFVALFKACVPDVFGVHCIIHQEVLCAKLDKGDRLKAVMDKVVQIVNFIRACPLHHCQFVELVDQIETEYGNLNMHIEVRWLRRGKLLDHFLALLPEIKQFLIQESQVYPELDENWILDVAFLVDITDHLNMLNESLQGKNHLLPTLIANVRKFMLHMLLMSTQLSSCDYTHFPHLKKNARQTL
ncbi:unnamed protein product [Eretmochelys imbricata]